MSVSRKLMRCHSIRDLHDQARRCLPAPIYHFLEGGSESENTARRNTLAFDAQDLIPRCLVDVKSVNTRTRVLGQEIEWPLFCSPTGASRLFHPDGELAVARAAHRAGTLYSLSTGATYSLEKVAETTSGPKMFQLYVFEDRDITRELVERCRRTEYGALCLTVDTPVVGKRERDLRFGFNGQPKLSMSNVMYFARRPSWVLNLAQSGLPSLANFADRIATGKAIGLPDPSLTWKDVRDIVDLWGRPLALKGVMSPDDARRAVDAGVSGVIVSNHGGRQLDGAAPTIEALPEIVKAVGNQIDVILDGGVRRGVHVLKALAAGAKACSIGRPYLYGLSVGGQDGVTKALNIIREEFVTAMRLCGCTDVSEIDAALLRRAY